MVSVAAEDRRSPDGVHDDVTRGHPSTRDQFDLVAFVVSR